MFFIFMHALTSRIVNYSHVDLKRQAAFLLFRFYGLELPLFSLLKVSIKYDENKKKFGAVFLRFVKQNLPNTKRSYVGRHGTTQQCGQRSYVGRHGTTRQCGRQYYVLR